MKYFKDQNNVVYAYEEDGSQDDFILPNLVSITKAEADSLTTPKPSGVPTTVSMRQARLALLQFGILGQVNSALSNGSEADKITWEYATEVRRDDNLVKNLAVSLGLNSASLDSLFTLAASL